MPIEVAEWREILRVLRETCKIWSPGLDRSHYNLYISRQLGHPWARKNYRFFVYKVKGAIVASCKLYTMELRARSRGYKFAGVAAVYTMEAHRGLGYASRLIEEVIELAGREGFAGLYLFSDIGAEFYERLGFSLAGNREFRIELPDEGAGDRLLGEAGGGEATAPLEQLTFPAEPACIPFLDRHYQRWLARQPLGVGRSPEYWSYKISRELYLHRHSSWSWPALEVTTTGAGDGYALMEHGSGTLRVLEVVGTAEAVPQLWRQLLVIALARKSRRLRGWESVLPPVLSGAPLNERSWGWPMILPLAAEASGWFRLDPCPLLELDHL